MKMIEFASAFASGINLSVRHMLTNGTYGAAGTTSAVIQPRVSARHSR
ncbi:MAG: hypothetical protein K8H74_11675 [Notoacmeibacter sp.]|nr:hypothetical protein [Notoacmeibacter sp.]